MRKPLIRLGLVIACLGIGALAASAEIVKSVAAGYQHTCALTDAGRVLCWGGNVDGELGDGTTVDRLTATQVTGLESGVAAIAVGAEHSCALTAGGAVLCWGNNEVGQIGDGTTTGRLTPTPVSGLSGGVTAISAGEFHTCAVTAAGGVVCWGMNATGQLGDNTTTDRLVPTGVVGLASGVAAVAGGELHTCALTTAGGMTCWGYNAYGQLGDGTALTRLTPTAVNGLGSGVASIAAGTIDTCAVTIAGAVLCWGGNAHGELGDGTQVDRSIPTAALGLTSGVAAVAAGLDHTCALTTGARMFCWGYNLFGQVGDGSGGEFVLTPAPVAGLGTVIAGIAVGGEHTVAVTAAGGVLSWGLNHVGQLGDGTTIDRPLPTAIATGYEAPLPHVVPVDLQGAGFSNTVVFRGVTAQWFVYGSSDVFTFGQAGDMPVVADYNGDGRAELAAYRPATSEWFIPGRQPVVFGQAGDVPVPGDYDGDGKAEIAVFRPSTGDWIVDGQLAPTHWGQRGDIPVPADYNGDGITEIAVFRPTTGAWWVMGGTTLQWGMYGDVPVPGDYNGDGKAEIAVYRPSDGFWYVANGPMVRWGVADDLPVPLDVDGDGRLEFVVYRPSSGQWFALNPTTSVMTSLLWGMSGDEPVGRPPHLPPAPALKTAGDFDGDGWADLTVFRPSTGGWYTLNSTSAYRDWVSVTIGQAGDIPVPGNYQGTGQERAVYRPSTGQWILEDGRTFTLGAPGDVPVPGDYDGDGLTDLGVFTPSTATWTALMSKTGYTQPESMAWGSPGDVPVPGDYDGDGKADLGVFTAATGLWRVFNPDKGIEILSMTWGLDGDIPVQVDYDGDGKTDVGVFRPSTGWWYGLFSSENYAVWQTVQWGAEGDIPVPADYDGDGKADVAVYRPSAGTWFVMDLFTIGGWGTTGDVPVLGR